MRQITKTLLYTFLTGVITLFILYFYHPSSHISDQNLEKILKENQQDPNPSKEKSENDLTLLKLALEADPKNKNLLFHLARTYKNLNRYDEAIHYCQARLEQKGHEDQIWYTTFLLGQCYQEKNDWRNALQMYEKAFSLNPKRAEPLQKIATYYRVTGQNDLAYQFAKQGAQIPYPGDQAFFVSKPVYDYQFDEELSIAAYYTPFRNEGFEAANRIVLNKKAPPESRENTYKNLLFYITNLENTRSLPVQFDFPKIKEGIAETYHPLNPSILKTEEGYKMICRTVNYIRTSQQGYVFPDPNDRYIRTKNFLLHYDKDFNLLSQQEIVENIPRQRHLRTKITGLEECRLIPDDQKTIFTCTTCDTSPTASEICYCVLGKETSGQPIYVEQLVPLKGPNPNRWEKNWLPFLVNNQLYAIYSHDPFIIYKPNLETGESKTILKYNPKHDLTRFKGSAGPIPFDDGYLEIVHETITNHQLNYIHRFVFLDKNFNIKKLSKPFTYYHMSIEFCCGMTLDHAGNHLIMTIGSEDREAYIYFVDLDTVRKHLEPIEETIHPQTTIGIHE